MKLRRLHNPKGWTSIPNAALEDRTISWRARGLLAYLLSRPDGWDTDSVRLAALAGEIGPKRSRTAEGRDAVRTALSELERAHYLHRVRAQGAGGRWSTEYYVFDVPTENGLPQALRGEIPLVHNPVDNVGTDRAPKTDYQSSENPASLTSTTKPIDPLSEGDPRTVAALPVEKDAAGGGAPSRQRAALAADEASAMPTLSTTDAIAQVSRLEPAISMFALRAHLAEALGFTSSFQAIAALVGDAHAASPPDLRGRLTNRDIMSWAQFEPSLLKPEPDSVVLETSGSAARPSGGLTAAGPA